MPLAAACLAWDLVETQGGMPTSHQKILTQVQLFWASFLVPMSWEDLELQNKDQLFESAIIIVQTYFKLYKTADLDVLEDFTFW